MTQQRLSETDAEYEKRKKRVTATYRNLGFGLAHGSISVVTAQAIIEYTWSADSYALNGSDEVILDNKGSSGATNDLLLNTGEPIEVSSGQEFDVPVEADSDCVAYYNITTKAWVYQTTISSPSWTIGQGTFGIIATLDNEPDATDKTRLDAEPWQILNLWLEETTNLTSIVKADIQHLYNPNILQAEFLQDIATALGGEKHDNTNGMTAGSGADVTVTYLGSGWNNVEVTSTANTASNRPTINIHNMTTAFESGKTYLIKHSIIINSGTVNKGRFYTSEYVSDIITDNYESTEIIYMIYNCSVNTSNFSFAFNSQNAAERIFDMDIRVDSIKEIDVIEIPNYAPSMYENVDFNKVGVQTTMLDIDGAGRLTGMVYDECRFYSKGYGDTQWNPTLVAPWRLTETIDTVQQVVVDTDNTNENADYLLGKGTYQKEAVDPYTSYSQTEFKIEET